MRGLPSPHERTDWSGWALDMVAEYRILSAGVLQRSWTRPTGAMPSGLYVGIYWQYGRCHPIPAQQLTCEAMDVASGSAVGHGSDDVGDFTTAGRFDDATLTLTKQYILGTGNPSENLGHDVQLRLTCCELMDALPGRAEELRSWGAPEDVIGFYGAWHVRTPRYSGDAEMCLWRPPVPVVIGHVITQSTTTTTVVMTGEESGTTVTSLTNVTSTSTDVLWGMRSASPFGDGQLASQAAIPLDVTPAAGPDSAETVAVAVDVGNALPAVPSISLAIVDPVSGGLMSAVTPNLANAAARAYAPLDGHDEEGSAICNAPPSPLARVWAALCHGVYLGWWSLCNWIFTPLLFGIDVSNPLAPRLGGMRINAAAEPWASKFAIFGRLQFLCYGPLLVYAHRGGEGVLEVSPVHRRREICAGFLSLAFWMDLIAEACRFVRAPTRAACARCSCCARLSLIVPRAAHAARLWSLLSMGSWHPRPGWCLQSRRRLRTLAAVRAARRARRAVPFRLLPAEERVDSQVLRAAMGSDPRRGGLRPLLAIGRQRLCQVCLPAAARVLCRACVRDIPCRRRPGRGRQGLRHSAPFSALSHAHHRRLCASWPRHPRGRVAGTLGFELAASVGRCASTIECGGIELLNVRRRGAAFHRLRELPVPHWLICCDT